MGAEDLRALAWLHEVERAPVVLSDLHRSGFPQTLSLLPSHHEAVTQMVVTLAAFSDIPGGEVTRCANDLAADYAGIYLTHALRAAPYESVWRDEDQLMMQAPTFAVREFYTRHGVMVQNWRHQPDDHLSHELCFLAVLLERGERREAARFLRMHLMVWLPLFTERVAQRAQTRFYAHLATLTLASVQSCLERLPDVAVIPTVIAVSASPCEGGCGAG
jgi:TorA maturation chaperone TorD